MGGAELVGPHAFIFDRVDRDDVLCSGNPSTLHGIDADTTDAHHHHGVAGTGLAGAHRAAVAGRDTATEQRGRVQRNAVVDLDE